MSTTTNECPSYTSLAIHPPFPDDPPSPHNNRYEVWGTFIENHPRLGAFDSDGIIGWLYQLANAWVFMNEAGPPTMAFLTQEDLYGWLQSKSPEVKWHTEPKA